MKTLTKKQSNTEKTLSGIQQKRQELKHLSTPLLELLKRGDIQTVNQGLLSIYHQQGRNDLKTLHQWNKLGYRIKKGEHALLLWGKPKKGKVEIKEENAEPEMFDFFPICFVFAINQVEERA